LTVKLGSDICEPVPRGTKTFVNGKSDSGKGIFYSI
jgi:hypothetical protein